MYEMVQTLKLNFETANTFIELDSIRIVTFAPPSPTNCCHMCVLAALFHECIFKSPVGAYLLRLGAFIFAGETPGDLVLQCGTVNHVAHAVGFLGRNMILHPGAQWGSIC
jgi:hypothetical protein